MADPDGELTVAQRLGRALDRGLLPAGGPAEAAERLIERLERPARVALLGLPGSGKSSILNLLVGAVVVPETLRLPTIIIQHGDVSRMVCTLTDGTTRILSGDNLAEVLPLAPALVTLEMDLPALRVISLLEVSAGPMEAEQKRAASWASKRADIVIWCTTSYLPKEQAVWESLPDAVKDNSFMFLTKVDLLGNRDAAQAMHDRVELRAGEEFRQILSISAKQARTAMAPGGQVNRDLFRDSGASSVIAAIKTRVQSGRRADMDTAELLLARHVEASELVARRFAEAEDEAPTAWTPPSEPETTVGEEAEAAPAEAEDGALANPATVAQPEAAQVPIEVAPAEPAPDVSRAENPAPEPPVPAVPDPEPTPMSTTRRRFADRIKRVATEGGAAAPPMVPLKSTWKSKADAEATPEPEPQPVRQPEPTRRPRAAAASALEQESERIAEPEIVPGAAPEPVVDFSLPAETSVEPVEPVDTAARERRPRAVTPRPAPAAPEATRPPRAPLFGRRGGTGNVGVPLPDLSSLRATPEEIAASAEAAAEEEDAQTAEQSTPPEQGDDQAVEPKTPTKAEPADVPILVGDRRQLFDPAPNAGPAEAAARPQPAPRAAPVSRMPASARPTTPVAAPEPVAARQPLDESQFSPRAIMMRDRRSEPEAPTPRRARTRIAALPAASAPVAPAQVSGTDHSLLDDAIYLIMTRSGQLQEEIDPEGKVPVDLILDHTRDTTEQVMALLARGQSDALRKVSSDLGEVMDLIMLMQLEKGHAPADDALTLLLQLKRELETLRVA